MQESIQMHAKVMVSNVLTRLEILFSFVQLILQFCCSPDCGRFPLRHLLFGCLHNVATVASKTLYTVEKSAALQLEQ